jgi:hypothetical protein
MIRIRAHATIGHTPDEDLLIAESEIYSDFVKRFRSLMRRLRQDHPDTEFNVSLTEDLCPGEIQHCPACGDRHSTSI